MLRRIALVWVVGVLPGCNVAPSCAEGEYRCYGGWGEQCRGGRWQHFFDGPCWITDTPGPFDVGPSRDVPSVDGADDAVASMDALDRSDATPLDAPMDAAATTDAPVAPDTGVDASFTPDAGVPATMTYCVDIDVSNTCEMTVTPTEIDVPADQIAYFCWRNRSRDYAVDVWLSYGGGYTDLAPGATWNEPPGHCLGPLPHDEYADISTACSSHRFLIHCL